MIFFALSQNFVSIPILNYAAEKIDQSPDILVHANSRTVFILVSALSQANHIPSNWETIMLPAIEKNDIFLMINRTEWHWLKFFSELVTLNYTDLTYVKRVVCKDYLEQYFAKHSSDLDCLQLLNLYQSVACRSVNPLTSIDCQSFIDKGIDLQLKYAECELKEFLELELGKNLILSWIISKFGHFIQHIVIRKKTTGEFVDVESFKTGSTTARGLIQLEDIKCKDDEQM